jgi:hypothetical protein
MALHAKFRTCWVEGAHAVVSDHFAYSVRLAVTTCRLSLLAFGAFVQHFVSFVTMLSPVSLWIVVDHLALHKDALRALCTLCTRCTVTNTG